MRRVGTGLAVALGMGWAGLATAEAELTGPEIMKRVDQRYMGDTRTAELEMAIIDADGSRRVREFTTFFKSLEDGDRQVLYVLSPAAIRNAGFLTYDYDLTDKDDDQWVYLPALGKPKRLSGSSQQDSFFGSDFSYADFAKTPIEEYEFELMGSAEVGGSPVWQVRGLPRSEEEKDRTGYVETVYFVRKDNFVTVRALFREAKGDRAKLFEVSALEEIGGVWVPTAISMTTSEGRKRLHKTELKVKGVKINPKIDDSLFTLRRLATGP